MSAILEFSIIPLDKETILSHYLSRMMGIIRESGLSYQFGPLSANIEGEWDDLMSLTSRCFLEFQQDSRHILVSMRLVWRAGRSGFLESAARV